MDLIRETGGRWHGIVRGFTDLDLAFGDEDENDFTLKLPKMYVRDQIGESISQGDFLFYPGTEWGGVVDKVRLDETSSPAIVTYYGRTWHGIMSHSILKPNSGQDYLTVSGSVQEVIADLVDRQGLGEVFEAVEGESGTVSGFQFDRYTDLYSGLRKMLKSIGMKLVISKGRGKCELRAAAAVDISDGVDDNYLSLDMSQDYRPVNHLVCLGKGELKDRVVVDLYMDEAGEVSQTRTFSGADEVAEIYDNANGDREDLIERGTDRLLDYFADASSIDAEIPDGLDARVGDKVTAKSTGFNFTVTAEVSAITVSAKYGEDPAVGYTVGSLKVI